MIRLVTFDALHTLVTPRLPIHLQYAQVFEPFLGHLPPADLKSSLKGAIKKIQRERPSYSGADGYEGWWAEVIKHTAIGAGANPHLVHNSLPEIVPSLLRRFSSREGYRLFDDALPTLRSLHALGVKTALVSNTDTRMLSVLEDLEAIAHLDHVLISEIEGIEKPAKEIFLRACQRAGVPPAESLHIGDELVCDYYGATNSGLCALLLRRQGPEGDGENKEENEDLQGVLTASSLADVLEWIDSTSA